jgi:hypothetical protein
LQPEEIRDEMDEAEEDGGELAPWPLVCSRPPLPLVLPASAAAALSPRAVAPCSSTRILY